MMLQKQLQTYIELVLVCYLAYFLHLQYNYQGLRTQKRIFNTNTYYLYEGSTLLAEVTGNDYIWYYYDESGVCGMNYLNNDYVFEKNILGDIIAIWTANATLVGRYNYDAWGRILNLSSVNGNSILQANSFRYRGYFYDTETNFYYLQSRYYDPAVGRFLNADDPTMLYHTADVVGGANLYSYCLNNPIMYVDSTGNNPAAIALIPLAWIVDAIIAAVVTVVAVAAVIITTPQSSTFDYLTNFNPTSPAIPIPHNTGSITWYIPRAWDSITLMGNPLTPNPNDPSKRHNTTKNGKSGWNRHSGKRSGAPEKGDSKRTLFRKYIQPKPPKGSKNIFWWGLLGNDWNSNNGYWNYLY